MTTQDRILFAQWQEQRAKRIPPEQRRLDDQFERDLEILRQEMARTK